MIVETNPCLVGGFSISLMVNDYRGMIPINIIFGGEPPAKRFVVVAICQQRSWSINDGRENHPKTILSWLCTQSGT